MPIESPFHSRTSELCTSLQWTDWSGYHAVSAYTTYHEREYYALRHAAGLMDVTPLFKYEVNGPDAAAFLSYVMVKNIEALKVGQVAYCCWCDEHGRLLDDGTVWRLDDNSFRATAAEPSLWWFRRHAVGFDVTIEESTDQVAALSLQGPRSREILDSVTDADLAQLRFFRLVRTRIGGFEATITRTGYTGDLGFEVWVANEHAVALWDILIEAGAPYAILPTGLDALDMARIEAGFIMNGVDYFSANHCLVKSRMSTPYDAGLGWTVNLDRDPFIGQDALVAEKQRGSAWAFVGIEVDWDEYEALFRSFALPPEVSTAACRNAVPVYCPTGGQVGQITSRVWSPILKQYIALATVERAFARLGTDVRVEVTAEYTRNRLKGTVRKKPFFDPPRKRN